MKKWLLSVYFLMNVHFIFSEICIQQGNIGLGYTLRRDHLKWSIAGEENFPNILSELTWKKLAINQVSFLATFETNQHLYVRAYADYGRIFRGNNRDSDYLGNNRSDEFARAISHADKGEVFDLSCALGYNIKFRHFSFIPLVGVSWEEQHLRLFHGKVILPFPSKIENLHSSYKTRWYGAWLGFDSCFRIISNLDLVGSFEYHFNEYRGRGHWNLRTDFLSDFKHYSSGQGILSRVGFNYHCDLNWTISLLYGFRSFKTGDGVHVLVIDEDGPKKVKSKLNPVKWTSNEFTLLILKNF